MTLHSTELSVHRPANVLTALAWRKSDYIKFDAMNKTKIAITILGVFLSFLSGNSQNVISASKMEREFFDPPVSARPKALWPWLNGNVSLTQITFELEEAVRKGMGGFDIWDIGVLVDPEKTIPAGPAFLSDESLQAIAHTIREADRLGLEIGLTFASSWNAGGSWVKPEYGAMGLFRTDTIVQGPLHFTGNIPFPKIPDSYGGKPVIQNRNAKTGLPVFYKEVALLAHRFESDSAISSMDHIVKLNPLKSPSGKISWKVPPGKWRIVRYVCAPTGQPLAIPSTNSKGLMLDHFSADAQRFNLNYIFSKLLPVTGPLKNRSLKYLYADSYEVNSAVWTPALPEAFLKKRGYAIEKYLPILDGFSMKDSDHFLFDFRKTLSDLIIENHYELGRKICEENGIGFCAEAGGPGQPIHNVPFEDLRALGAVTIPRGEFWNKHPQLELLQVVKGIASASHIYNQKYVEAESFTSVWLWQEGPDELKPLADRAMAEGLNRFVYHTFPHTPPEAGDPGWVYNFGTLINTTNGWWPKSKGFHLYLARCSYLLQQGNFVGDVAFYYGDEAPNFVGPKKIPDDLGFGYDYDVINSEILLSKLEVRNNRLYLPHGQYYEVLVLPPGRSVNPDVLKKIEQLVKDGATIIGPKPDKGVSLNHLTTVNNQIQQLTNSVWGSCDSIQIKENSYGKGKIVWGKPLRDVLIEKGIEPDVTSNQSDRLDFIHRKTENEEIYFIRNISNAQFSDRVSFRVNDLVPQLWNAESGEIIPIPVFSTEGGRISIPLSFDSEESKLIVFRKGNSKPTTSLSAEGIANPVFYFTKAGTVTSTSGNWRWKVNQEQEKTKTVSLPSPVELKGPWYLRFDQTKGAPPRDTLQTLIPLNESRKTGVKYYSGVVTYQTSFEE
jgi:hypothetical protein